MKQIAPRIVASLAGVMALSVITGLASAQGIYPVKRMDFDLWCTEEMRLPFERCAQRLTDDLQKFDDYRALIEKYDVRQQQDRQRRMLLEHTVLNNDPVDNPIGSMQRTDKTTLTGE
ncbi:MAG: hypothetical protein WCD42_13830 [Rhizomicrobium sp.]